MTRMTTKTATDRHFGRAMRAAFETRGWSQRAAARHVGVALSTVQTVLKSARPRMNTLTYEALASALGLSIEQLNHTWNGTPPETGSATGRRRAMPIRNARPGGVASNIAPGVPELPRSLYPDDSAAVAVWVEDEAMAPTIRKGELLVISPAATIERGDMVYVERSSDIPACFIRRCFFDEQHGIYAFKADAPQLPPFTVYAKHIQFMGRVVLRIASP